MATFKVGKPDAVNGLLLDGVLSKRNGTAHIPGSVIRQGRDFEVVEIAGLTGSQSATTLDDLESVNTLDAALIQFSGLCTSTGGSLTFRPVYRDEAGDAFHVGQEIVLTPFSLAVSGSEARYPSYGDPPVIETLGAHSIGLYFPSPITGTWLLRAAPL